MTNAKQYEADKFGFVEYAERMNGRVAMLGMVIAIVTQLVAGRLW